MTYNDWLDGAQDDDMLFSADAFTGRRTDLSRIEESVLAGCELAF